VAVVAGVVDVVVEVDGPDVEVDEPGGGGGVASAELGTGGSGSGPGPAGERGSVVVVVGSAVVVVGGAVVVVVVGGAVEVVVAGGGEVVVGAGDPTSIVPVISEWYLQWYVYVPGVLNRFSNCPSGRISPESKTVLPGSEVTVWRSAVPFVQMILSFTLTEVVLGAK
jgi:hypothetical protein